nr:reverse transcriptase domain-containing protein [Tanacetum cinerariifolium]
MGQKWEAWRSQEKFKAVTVDRGRKTEENAKRMVENAYTENYFGVHRSSSKLSRDLTSNSTSSTNPTPQGRISRNSKRKVENSYFEENPLPPPVPMAKNQTMTQLLQAPTDGYEDAIVIPEIAANNFKLKHGLINLVQNKQFFGHEKEDPHAHLRYFNKITSTMRSKSKVRQTRAKAVVAKVSLNSSTPAVSADVAELKDMVRALL